MPIEIVMDSKLKMTVHAVEGVVTKEEMWDALEHSHYNPTARLLWDLTNADVSNVETSALKRFVQRSVELSVLRKGGRTAIVAPNDLAFGMSRMSSLLAEQKESAIELSAFRTRQDAIDWLLELKLD